MNKLFELLEESILIEGRKEEVMAKYPSVSKEAVAALSAADPSGNNKYLEWMVKVVADGVKLNNIIPIVTVFHEKQNLINADNVDDFLSAFEDDLGSSSPERIRKSPKDINSFGNFSDLKYFTEFLKTVTSKRQELEQMKKESDRIYEDTDLLVVSPKTHKASCLYGKHSSWCVATANTNHFTNYTKNGTLYFFISKTDKAYNKHWKDKDDGRPPYKTALLINDNGDRSWWSKGDSNYSNGWIGDDKLPMLTQEIADKIMVHQKFAIENRKQREIERILISKGFYKRHGGDSALRNDFTSFVKAGIFKAEQILVIIRNDNWLALYENSDTGKKVREILGAKTVFALIREMLNGGEITEVLKDMHSQEFLSTISVNLSDDENREIANIILKKLGKVEKGVFKKPTASEVGGDVKMYVDKWTMSPEDWARYEAHSNYFYIGKLEPVQVGTDKRGEPIYEKLVTVDGLTKVDRFNPKDHHVLQMMMLRTKIANSNLYAVTSNKNEFDAYLGGNNNMAPEVVKTLMAKSKKLNPES